MKIVMLNRDYYERLHSMIPGEYYQGLYDEDFNCMGLVGESDNTLCGVAILMPIPQGAEVIWICATPEYQRKGFTEQILSELKELFVRTDPEQKIYATFPTERINTENDNISIKAVYDAFISFGAVQTEYEGGLYCIESKDIFELPLRQVYRKYNKCVSLIDAMSWQINDMQNRMREDERGVPVSSCFRADRYNSDISVLYCEGEKVTGAFLVNVEDGKEIDVELAWSVSKTGLIEMMLYSIKKLEEKYPDAEKIYVPTVNEISAKLVEKLFPMAKKESNRKLVVTVND